MPKSKTFVKPGKENLIAPLGRKAASKAGEVMAGMERGEERTGQGKQMPSSNHPNLPDYMPEPENLDAEGIAQKRVLRGLLVSVLVPNSLSSKTSGEQDKRSLVSKLNKRTLKELKGFVPDRINRMSVLKLQNILDGTEEITDEEKVEMQDLYKDISP